DRQTWNYALYPGVTLKADYGKFDEYWGIGHVLRDMKVSDKAREHGGKNEVMFLQHGHDDAYHELIEEPYQVNGQWYHVSKSHFPETPQHSSSRFQVIIAMDREGPKAAANDREPKVPESELPKISRGSDIQWALWENATESVGHLTNIKTFFSLTTVNVVSQSLIVRALNQRHVELSPFPGYRFTPEDEEGQVLLGKL
ncbi:hypothetical protein K505DRAFT_230244, partial [Melanomma pulvis-pyrius CBS 109.77]